MKTVIIIQARMTSTRLPGKVLKIVLGKPLLAYQIERLRRAKKADEIIVAATRNVPDDPIIKLCESLSIKYYRGSEDDVLSRYYEAAKLFGADVVVRVTADCPLIDPKVVDQVITYYLDNKNKYDYVSNCFERSYPRGMDVEAFSLKVLGIANNNAKNVNEREHVTPYIYMNPGKFNLANIKYKMDASAYRWTVDTQEDYELIKIILETLYPTNSGFSLEDILQLMTAHPEYQKINEHINQKKLTDK